MWQLKTPIDQLVFRSTVIFFALLIFLRILGKKHLGELSNFDFILLLIISEGVQNALVDDDKSITAGLIVSATLLIWSAIINHATFSSRYVERIVEGQPKIIIQSGQVLFDVLQKEKISIAELEESLRLQGVHNISDVDVATIEANGKISVIKK